MRNPDNPPPEPSHHIGTLNEGPLHAALKQWYQQRHDRIEVKIDGYFVDILRGEQIIEIQTGGFTAIRQKLKSLLRQHRVRLVYPMAENAFLLKMNSDLTHCQRRLSPKHRCLHHLFEELIALPKLINHPNFDLEILLIEEEQVRNLKPKKRSRKGWRLVERRLLNVRSQHLFQSRDDLLALLPDDLNPCFDTAELASKLGIPRHLAQKMAYCLRHCQSIEVVGKKGNALLYQTIDQTLHSNRQYHD